MYSEKIFYKIIKKVLTNEIKYAIIMPERIEMNKKPGGERLTGGILKGFR